MPTAVIKTHWQKQQCEFKIPADLFAINFGYKDRNHVKLRLEDDGAIFLSHTDEAAPMDEGATQLVTMTFDVFEKEWRKFIRYLQSVTG